jgi:GAF domain-containing protein
MPLIARDRVIGALSVQSAQRQVFDPDMVATLQTMADQVAVALDNARLYAESQEALETTRRAYGEMTREAWLELLRSRTDWGYSFAHQAIAPAEGDWQPEMLRAMQTGLMVLGTPSGAEHQPEDSQEEPGTNESMVAIPLKVRDEAIGVLSFYKDSSDETQPAPATEWTSAETRLLERLVQQMGLALESAQFYEETQRRAVREQTAREVTARMRQTLDVDSILRTAAQEVRQALDLPEVVVRLRPPSEDDGQGEVA